VAGRRPHPALVLLRHGRRGGIAGGRTALRQGPSVSGKQQATAKQQAPMGVDDDMLRRFFSYTEGDTIYMQRGGLRSLLECTESSCMPEHWLPDSFVDSVYTQYATKNGIGLWEFINIASDGLLLKGRLEEYEKAFAAIDKDGDGVLTWEDLNQLFAGLGAPAEFDRILDEAGLPPRRGLQLGFDGLDFADFVGLARTRLDFAKVLENIITKTSSLSKLPVDMAPPPVAPDGSLGTVTTVHSKTEIDAIVASGADTVVELAFTWCQSCNGFWPEYTNFAKDYSSIRFLKIVGNENESTGQYAEELMKMADRIAPLFAAYSKGKLVIMWSGANKDRFSSTMEEFVQIAGQKSVGHANPQYVSSQGHRPIAS